MFDWVGSHLHWILGILVASGAGGFGLLQFVYWLRKDVRRERADRKMSRYVARCERDHRDPDAVEVPDSAPLIIEPEAMRAARPQRIPASTWRPTPHPRVPVRPANSAPTSTSLGKHHRPAEQPSMSST